MMMSEQQLEKLAKIIWQDPQTGTTHEFVLMEGATASIGRQDDNDICIKEQHVSRRHAVINYRMGIFTITDLGSANGTFVNDEKLSGEYPLASGDEIRLFVPRLIFSSTVSEDDHRQAEEQGTLITAITKTGQARLVVTNGPQENESIPLMMKKVMIGRAVTNAEWQICLQDSSVSRPHAILELTEDKNWLLTDLGSANGTFVNGTPVGDKGRTLADGDVVKIGLTTMLFRHG